MRLTVLGCRSGVPADGQASSGYLVEAAGTLLLDCGPGVATAVSGAVPPAALGAVVVSHLHVDHCYDLLPLGKALLTARARRVMAQRKAGPLDALRHLDTAAPGVPLLVPAGGRELLAGLAALFPMPTFPLLERAFEVAFDVREYAPGDVLDVAGFRVTPHLLRHAAPNCGMRVEADGAVLAYTGDTGPCPGLAELAAGADLFLAECTLDHTDDGAHGHLCAADAAAVAAANGVGELVLTHFTTADPAGLAAHRAAAEALFTGPVRTATPGARFPVPTRHPAA
ncbi:MBL fold metallo-hydrolase [Pseudonocardia sp. CNS-139]|nr:MBL fold metallo-hydrolase [Pseudonocardia sp. CNS-139]